MIRNILWFIFDSEALVALVAGKLSKEATWEACEVSSGRGGGGGEKRGGRSLVIAESAMPTFCEKSWEISVAEVTIVLIVTLLGYGGGGGCGGWSGRAGGGGGGGGFGREEGGEGD